MKKLFPNRIAAMRYVVLSTVPVPAATTSQVGGHIAYSDLMYIAKGASIALAEIAPLAPYVLPPKCLTRTLSV